tara:strand:- start:1682 stop:3418 length:1737 start_codon:yes stop_codon:yes gene_type:complete
MPYIGKSPSAGVRQRYQYTATAGQTTFTGTDLDNLTLTYTDNNFVDVFQNGVLLKGGTTDYTATSGTSVVLTTGASVSDVIEIIVYDVFSVGNFYSRTDSDSRYAKTAGATMSGALDLNGQELILDADADTSITADTDDQIDIKIAGSDKLKIDANSHLVTTTAGTSNFVLGVNAGNSIASGGNYNVCIGDEAGTALTTGDNNVAVGFEALATEDAHGDNTAIGYQALKTLNAGADTFNVAVGYQAGTSVTTGTNNTLIGSFTGDAITDGSHNTALGISALSAETRGSKSVAVGEGALQFQNKSDSTGNMYNTAVGYEAGNDITTGTSNVFVGGLAGDALTTGSRNVALGYATLTDCTHSGNGYNTCVGYEAGNSIVGGEQNTIVGANAGNVLTSANRCTVVGYNCETSASGAFDQTVLGNEVTASGNSTFTFGTGSSDSAIGNGGTSISAPSDQRYKESIETSTAGIGFINDLRPVTYKWKMEKDIPTDHRAYVKDSTTRVMNAKDELYHGFIAQEVKAVVDNHSEIKNYDELWSENDDGRQRLAPAFLIPMLTKAIQELSAKNDALEARIKTLEDG